MSLVRLLSLFFVSSIGPLLTGCETTAYYWQAARGQWEIIRKSRPIDEVMEELDRQSPLYEKLLLVKQVRAFAQDHLRLPVGDAYADYADLEREAVVWNVVAAPEFELKNKTWCFPVAGCAAYKGFFERKNALKEASTLENEGYDVSMAAIPAYSTLGWFDDPVLNTFVYSDNRRLAELLLHELAHRRFYVKDDTMLNESWASAVAEVGLQAFLVRTQCRIAAITNQKKNALTDRQTMIFFKRLDQALVELNTLYEAKKMGPGNYSLAVWREKKQAILQRFQSAFDGPDTPQIPPRYRAWLRAPLNNATLLSLKNYQQWVPALQYQLITVLNGNWQAFYQWSDTLAKYNKDERTKLLESLNGLANPE